MPNLGNKFECYSCGTKFYDLGKSEPLCPKCGANQRDAATSEAEERQAAKRRRRDEPARVVDETDLPVEEGAADTEFDDELTGGDEGEDEEPDDLDDEA
jgi:uncharacterized protein (TIGR02300 family)